MSNKLGARKKRELNEIREYLVEWYLMYGEREVMDWKSYNLPKWLESKGYMYDLGAGVYDGYPQEIFKITPKALELIKS